MKDEVSARTTTSSTSATTRRTPRTTILRYITADTRDTAPSANAVGTITNFRNPYLNIAPQIRLVSTSMRATLRLVRREFTTQLQATRMLTQKIEFFPDVGSTTSTVTLGYPGFGSGPKWTGSLDTRFKTANDITFRWGVEYIGKMSSQDDANVIFLNDTGDGLCEGAPAASKSITTSRCRTISSTAHRSSGSGENVGQFTIGVSNLFDKDPPTISDDNVNGYPRFGNFFANGAYDYRGRSFFVNVTKTF